MATLDLEPQAVRRQLERALASTNFVRSERQSRFLRFVVERHLEGRDDELKESVIALEVFGNRDYDPNQDSTVRTEAGRLRARLAEYYAGNGAADPLIIQLPKGGYVPVFHRADERHVPRKRPLPRRWWIVSVTALAIALSGIGWWRVQHQNALGNVAVL